MNRKAIINPTPIQTRAIPYLMNGYDVIGIAPTGSGKTLAYAIPLIQHLLANHVKNQNVSIFSLILVPTRELAYQIYKELQKYITLVGFKPVLATGGVDIKHQITQIKRGFDVIIGTPGRILDLSKVNNSKLISWSFCTYIVLDEVDRMVDSGFYPQIRQIVTKSNPNRQSSAFSATLPYNLEKSVRKMLKKPILISCGGRNSLCSSIEQKIFVVNKNQKFIKLLEILGQIFVNNTHQTIIFVESQTNVDNLFKNLVSRGYLATTIHAGNDHVDRGQGFNDFLTGTIPILIATSLAARGLDIRDLDSVINYDPPSHAEDFIHRVGRTGRAGNSGVAYTILTPDDNTASMHIKRLLDQNNIKYPDELSKLADKSIDKDVKDGFKGRGLYKVDEKREKQMKQQEALFQDIDALKSEPTLDRPVEELAIISDIRPISSDNKDGIHICDIDINDYPSISRTKITAKETILNIKQETGALITVSGEYIPNTIISDPNLKKKRLHLEVDGPSYYSVQQARDLILDILKTTSLNAGISLAKTTTKYKLFPDINK